MSSQKFKLLEIINGVTFYVLRDWLKNNELWAVVSTSAVPLHMRTFFKTNIPFLGHQQCHTESWLLESKLRGTYKGATYEDTLRTWWPRILLQTFESVRTSQQNYMELKKTVTKTNAIAKNAENTYFCNSSFLSFLYISLNINPFFNRILALFPFSRLGLLLQ